jgi:hypothetical protein
MSHRCFLIEVLGHSGGKYVVLDERVAGSIPALTKPFFFLAFFIKEKMAEGVNFLGTTS